MWISGAHLVLYSSSPESDRKFFRDILKFPYVDAGDIDKDIDPEYLTLMVLALSFYPRVFAAVTKTLTGLAPSDPEFERRWSELLNELGRRLQEPEEHG